MHFSVPLQYLIEIVTVSQYLNSHNSFIYIKSKFGPFAKGPAHRS